jgi:GxxExxY protein
VKSQYREEFRTIFKVTTMKENYKYADLTEIIIGAFFNVYNQLGYGFFEKVYERAMMIELPLQGLKCECQKSIKVYYKDIEIGNYFADILVEDVIVIELKAVETILPIHEVQLVNYLKATGKEVGLILNFGPKPQFKRRVLSNKYHEDHN